METEEEEEDVCMRPATRAVSFTFLPCKMTERSRARSSRIRGSDQLTQTGQLPAREHR